MDNELLIQVVAGLGNQLFELATAYELSIKYNRKLIVCINNGARNRGTYWDNILSFFKPYLVDDKTFQNLKKKSTKYSWAVTKFHYKEIILNKNIQSYCLEGYYQSHKYFSKEKCEKIFNFSETYNQNTQELQQLVEKIQDNDLALHIRRTDYLKNNFHKVLAIDYYKNAIKDLRDNKNLKINKIYIFSDDINYCKKHLDFGEFGEYITLKKDIDELILMSKFKNIVMANSSFSWWAAYIGRNDKIIYSPKHWFIKNCHLQTQDLRPNNWFIIDDDAKYEQEFNIISLGSACTMVHNIHENCYSKLGPLYRQPENKTNFFDWVITDFNTVVNIFENLSFKDNNFIKKDKFTFDNIYGQSNKLHGGWNRVYRKIEHKDFKMISLHDVKKELNEIPNDFIDKYKRRFDRLYQKCVENKSIHFVHCLDFQWLNVYIPTKENIKLFFKSIKIINPILITKLYFLIPPKYNKPENKNIFEELNSIDNVEVFYLEDKGFRDDWKAGNLTFDKFFMKLKI